MAKKIEFVSEELKKYKQEDFVPIDPVLYNLVDKKIKLFAFVHYPERIEISKHKRKIKIIDPETIAVLVHELGEGTWAKFHKQKDGRFIIQPKQWLCIMGADPDLKVAWIDYELVMLKIDGTI